MDEALVERVDSLPTTAGVYLFKGGAGEVLYVGKANNLRARVRQYFGRHDGRAMIPLLLLEIRDFEVVLVRTEKEALILENTLIKKHLPRFNSRLRDDKNFLHLRIDPREAWPRFLLVRKILADGARSFGPFHSASQARKALRELLKTFPLRSCSDTVFRSRRRPCILHAMHRCLAPCVGLCDAATYRAIVEEACLFLEGRRGELLDRLNMRMMAEAEEERFEEAARLRDLIRAIEGLLERQRVLDPLLVDRDVWGLCQAGTRTVAAIVPVRAGHMLEPTALSLDAEIGDEGELLSTLLNRHYDPQGAASLVIPPEILVRALPPDHEALDELLTERAGRRVRVFAPARGEKIRLLELAEQNARHRLRLVDNDARALDEADAQRALQDLARICQLKEPPHRIECFDNSNLQGTDPVASMVVFVDGEPERSEYRRYRVKNVEGPDDYASMREILGRRFRRVAEEGSLPDLVVLDGGKGQISAVRAILTEIGFENQPIIGLAKPRTERSHGDRDSTDKIILPDLRDPVRLRANQPALRLLQRLRDESHRFALHYHRKVRSERALTSILQEIPGLGPKRARALLRHFGSVKALLEAPPDELARVPGIGSALMEQIQRAIQTARRAQEP